MSGAARKGAICIIFGEYFTEKPRDGVTARFRRAASRRSRLLNKIL